ncbi:PilZ domain-containing protein [bacterium]|nr:PilZ domain-containing protein [bacterium]
MKSENTSWFVLIGEQKYGPYDYKTVIQMIQSNQLMDFNYVWAEHLEAWTPIYQLEEFSKDRFELLLQKESEYLSSFIKRKGQRVEVKIPIIGHNSIRFFDGEIVSISESGALCLLNSPLVQVGDQIKIHVKPVDSDSFNVECEIIRKNYSKQRLNSKSGLYYAVRFNEIQNIGVEQIKKWIDKAA